MIKRSACCLFLVLLFWSGKSIAQPYFDPFAITGWSIPKGGSNVPAAESYLNVSAGVPLSLGERKLLLVRMYYEQRNLDYSDINREVSLYGTGLPLTLLLTSRDSAFKHAVTFVTRSNAEEWRFDEGSFQLAFAYLVTWQVKSNLSLQAGAYYSREFFSDFYLPLVGINWKISPRVNFFGVFPNAMRFEYNLAKNVFIGADFKSVLNSYRSQLPGNAYWKVADNQIGLFAEYAVGGKFVLYAAGGNSFLRRVKKRNFGDQAFPEITGDQYYLKAGMYYRIRQN
jgi:hypothetical protein